jgi:hypothetical protein
MMEQAAQCFKSLRLFLDMHAPHTHHYQTHPINGFPVADIRGEHPQGVGNVDLSSKAGIRFSAK